MHKKQLAIVLLIILVPCCLLAQLKEIRSIQSALPAIKDSAKYVDALNRLSIVFHTKSVDSCLLYAEKAKAIADRLKYPKGIADALNCIGIVYAIKTNTYLAAKYFNNALDIYRQTHDSSNECQLIMNLGVVLSIDNKNAEALEYFRNAYQLGSRLSNDSIQALVIINLLSIDSTMPVDSVKSLFNQARGIATKYHDERTILICTETEAAQLLKQAKRSEAIVMLKNSVMYADSIGCEYERMNIYITLGDVLLKTDPQQAVKYYQDALTTSTADGYTDDITTSAQKLYDYYISIKDTSHADKYADALLKEYRSYQQFVQQSGISYLDYALKDRELEDVKANSETRRSALIAVSILSVVILILLFFTFSSIQARKKYVALLKQRNEMAINRNEELQSKNAFNNRLISLLAHDFRQPLAAVRGMISLMKEPDALSKEEMDYLLENLDKSSGTSLEIFDNILHWIKKQISGFVYAPVSMNLSDLVNEAGKSLQYLTDKFSICIKNSINNVITVNADKELIQFVNRNLIHNAIKFSPAGATITIDASETATEIVVAVKDQGKGMSKENAASLFNIFSKTQYSSEKEKGAGVALVICKEFLERMNGRIWVESEPGCGTTFFYALPVNSSAAAFD